MMDYTNDLMNVTYNSEPETTPFDSTAKIRCFEITLGDPDGGNAGRLITTDLEYIKEADVGEMFFVRVLELTSEEFDALPDDFDGF